MKKKKVIITSILIILTVGIAISYAIINKKTQLIIVDFQEYITQPRIHKDLRSTNQYLIELTVIVEDPGFYNKREIDNTSFVNRVLRPNALYDGASIEQKIVRSYLNQKYINPDMKMINYQIEELILINYILKSYTKNEIIEIYLTNTYYLSNKRGVEYASQELFSKEAKDLSIFETALLVGISRAPEYYDPRSDNEKWKTTTRFCLEKSLKEGLINELDYKSALGQIESEEF